MLIDDDDDSSSNQNNIQNIDQDIIYYYDKEIPELQQIELNCYRNINISDSKAKVLEQIPLKHLDI